MIVASYPVLNGLTLNGVDSYGVQWVTSNIQGWGGAGDTLAPVQKPRQAGAWGGLSYEKARPIVVTGTAIAPDATTASLALDRLIAATTLDTSPFAVVEPSRTLTANVRRDGEVIPTWRGDAAFDWSIQLIALDPRKFGQTLTAGPTGLPSSSGGLTAPFTAPFTVPATQNSGLLTLTNSGNATGPVTLRIDGPGSGPIITHVGTGAALVFSASAVLASGEFWTIDMEKRTVLAQGQASRNGYITSRGWSGFDPGVNQWAFSSASTSAMTLTVTATEAFQ